jgi:hypothetical protein
MEKAGLVAALILLLCLLTCGCTITNGVFTGMSSSSAETSLSVSYQSFDGSIAKRLALQKDDNIIFSLEGDTALSAAVKQDGTQIFCITDGSVFTVPENGKYDFAVFGESENGAFALSWQIE